MIAAKKKVHLTIGVLPNTRFAFGVDIAMLCAAILAQDHLWCATPDQKGTVAIPKMHNIFNNAIVANSGYVDVGRNDILLLESPISMS
jgi:hypothetical protein